MNEVMKCLKDNDVIFFNQSFEITSEIVFAVRKMFSNKIYETLKKIEGLIIKYAYTY